MIIAFSEILDVGILSYQLGSLYLYMNIFLQMHPLKTQRRMRPPPHTCVDICLLNSYIFQIQLLSLSAVFVNVCFLIRYIGVIVEVTGFLH